MAPGWLGWTVATDSDEDHAVCLPDHVKLNRRLQEANAGRRSAWQLSR